MQASSNPLLTHEINILCAICNRTSVHELISINKYISTNEPELTAAQFIRSITEFLVEKAPQQLCKKCFKNTISCYKYVQMCIKANANIEEYLQQKSAPVPTANANESEEEIIDVLEIEEVDLKAIHDDDEENIDLIADTAKPTLSINKSTNTKVACTICKKLYNCDYIRQHTQRHSSERRYFCEVCGKPFYIQADLRKHLKTHEAAKSFFCCHCGQGYKTNQALKIHERTHTGDKPYKCKYCEKAFTTSGLLSHHHLVHTNEKRFSCERCGKCFNRKTNLKMHLRSHEGIKLFECHLCGNRFTQKHSLQSHVLKVCQKKLENDGQLILEESALSDNEIKLLITVSKEK